MQSCEEGATFVFIKFVIAIGMLGRIQFESRLQKILGELINFGCLEELVHTVHKIGDPEFLNAIEAGKCAAEDFMLMQEGVDSDAVYELTQMFRFPDSFENGVMYSLAFCSKIMTKKKEHHRRLSNDTFVSDLTFLGNEKKKDMGLRLGDLEKEVGLEPSDAPIIKRIRRIEMEILGEEKI